MSAYTATSAGVCDHPVAKSKKPMDSDILALVGVDPTRGKIVKGKCSVDPVDWDKVAVRHLKNVREGVSVDLVRRHEMIASDPQGITVSSSTGFLLFKDSENRDINSPLFRLAKKGLYSLVCGDKISISSLKKDRAPTEFYLVFQINTAGLWQPLLFAIKGREVKGPHWSAYPSLE